ncbi:MAG: DUF2812 domain-containing protein [Oscillospiraceae bacterium]|jgi:hypothetical protein|nr:DUF2812 domain-containing protein [Oscillospiraceae bacterium]
MNKKTVILPAFRHVVPSDFEAMMEKYALEGWNVDVLNPINSMYITFHKTEPKKYRYVFDLNLRPTKDYRQTYEQFGWALVGNLSSCFIWRKAYTDVRPESFTDRESLMRRNLRVRNALAFCLALALIGAAANVVGLFFEIKDGVVLDILGQGLGLVICIGLAGVLWRFIRKMNKNLDR